MTAAPRRRRHDPLPPAGAGRVEPPGPSTIDLHTHTTRSDGVVAPAELVRQAAAVGVRLLSLTDHDTLAGYRDVVAAGAVPDGLTLLPGVEINAIVTRDLGLWEGELHILGFGMDPADDAFEAVLAAQRDRRRERFERTVALLRDLDLSIDAQIGHIAAAGDDALGRPTVARALVAAGHAASVDDAFMRLLAWGKPAYVPRTGLGPLEAIAAIRAAAGLPVLAHFGEAAARVEVVARAGRGRPRRARGLLPLVRHGDRRLRGRRCHLARPGRDRRLRLPRRHRHVRPGARRAVGPAGGRGGGPRCRLAGTAMTDRSTLTRELPMLELVPPPAAAPRQPAAPGDARLREYLPEARTLPRFHLWTLGCQMNRSDSEEMAGRLLAGWLRGGGDARERRPHRHQHAARSARAPSRRSSAGWASWRGSRRPTRACGSS